MYVFSSYFKMKDLSLFRHQSGAKIRLKEGDHKFIDDDGNVILVITDIQEYIKSKFYPISWKYFVFTKMERKGEVIFVRLSTKTFKFNQSKRWKS